MSSPGRADRRGRRATSRAAVTRAEHCAASARSRALRNISHQVGKNAENQPKKHSRPENRRFLSRGWHPLACAVCVSAASEIIC
jgi:hypothetical protein